MLKLEAGERLIISQQVDGKPVNFFMFTVTGECLKCGQQVVGESGESEWKAYDQFKNKQAAHCQPTSTQLWPPSVI